MNHPERKIYDEIAYFAYVDGAKEKIQLSRQSILQALVAPRSLNV
jgi:hypothetical protein